jgi:hypothetical protein
MVMFSHLYIFLDFIGNGLGGWKPLSLILNLSRVGRYLRGAANASLARLRYYSKPLYCLLTNAFRYVLGGFIPLAIALEGA